jgi:methyltransferase (TIGR00027 family)
MTEDQPSQTALRVAMRRATHQILDSPRIHEDPLALTILGEEQAAAIRTNPGQFENGPAAPYLRAFLAVRSRVAEDALAHAVASGVRHYVVLGAGLDTFAYRNPHPELHVVEFDHPATQTWKRQRLAEAGLAVPDGVTFVATDFTSEPLSAALDRAGLRREEPAFFSWLGVAPYLESADVLAALAAIAPFAAGGGGVVLDYCVPPASLGFLQRAAFEFVAARAAAAGEPFRSFFEPQALVDSVRGLGFREVRDVPPDELNASFFADRADGLRVASAGHILVALG